MQVSSEQSRIGTGLLHTLMQQCDFYAIDLEMTGIRTADMNPQLPPHIPSEIAPPALLYKEKITSARTFSVLEIGFALMFKADALVRVPAALVDVVNGSAKLPPDSNAPDIIFPPVHPESQQLWTRADEMILRDSTGQEFKAMVRNELMQALAVLKSNHLRSEKKFAPVTPSDTKSFLSQLSEHEDCFLLVKELTHLLDVVNLYCALGNKNQWISFDQRFPLIKLIGSKPFSMGKKGLFATAPTNFISKLFSFLIFPADFRNVTLSSETVGTFLAQNSTINFNEWIRNGVRFSSREKTQISRHQNLFDFEQFIQKNIFSRKSQSVLVSEKLSRVGCENKQVKKLVEDVINLLKKPDQSFQMSFPFVDKQAFGIVMDFLRERGVEKKDKLLVYTPTPESVKKNTDINMKDACPVISVAEKLSNFCNGNLSVGNGLLDAIRTNKTKPMICQNGWSDLAFLYTTFHDTDPANLESFKAAIHELIPIIYDSRTLACLETFNDFSNRGALKRQAETFESQIGPAVGVTIGPAEEELVKVTNAHDASFDALMSAYLYLMARAQGLARNVDVHGFRNIIPTFGSACSIKLDAPHDVIVSPSSRPRFIILETDVMPQFAGEPEDRALFGNLSRIQQALSEALRGVSAIANRNAIVHYVDSSAPAQPLAKDAIVSKLQPIIGARRTISLREADAAVLFGDASANIQPFWIPS